MTNLLINCYFDGLTIAEAREFIERCTGEAVTETQINRAVASILESAGDDWTTK